jgi:6-pyruvoyltetrahydropterin/6-carboxytetrahydropterin synthase
MYILKVTDTFSAAHSLRGYGGKCEKLHGHNWKIDLELAIRGLDECGISMDFKEAKRILAEALADYDHTDLNALPDFAAMNPSAENIAARIQRRIREKVKGHKPPVERVSVSVWESENSCCRFEEETGEGIGDIRKHTG